MDYARTKIKPQVSRALAAEDLAPGAATLRGSMIVASALIHIGLSTESAFRSIEESSGCPYPTLTSRDDG
jgi:hypothetical protein